MARTLTSDAIIILTKIRNYSVTNYAALVTALYAELGTWQRVADACNGASRTHSAGYYQQVATGRIKKPSAETRAGIERAPAWRQSLLKSHFSRDTRKTVHLLDDDHAAGNLERKRLSVTWPAMVRLWRLAYDEKAHELMRREYEGRDEVSEKKLHIEVEFFCKGISQGVYVSDPCGAFDGIVLGDCGEGDSYKFTGVMMTQEEYNALPEFNGF